MSVLYPVPFPSMTHGETEGEEKAELHSQRRSGWYSCKDLGTIFQLANCPSGFTSHMEMGEEWLLSLEPVLLQFCLTPFLLGDRGQSDPIQPGLHLFKLFKPLSVRSYYCEKE